MRLWKQKRKQHSAVFECLFDKKVTEPEFILYPGYFDFYLGKTNNPYGSICIILILYYQTIRMYIMHKLPTLNILLEYLKISSQQVTKGIYVTSFNCFISFQLSGETIKENQILYK